MTAKFGATSTTDDVLAGLDLKDKRVLVTGTSSGLGIESIIFIALRRSMLATDSAGIFISRAKEQEACSGLLRTSRSPGTTREPLNWATRMDRKTCAPSAGYLTQHRQIAGIGDGYLYTKT